MSETKATYSFVFDKKKEAWICSVHGETATAWVPCWNGCQDGFFDAYEDDPLLYDEGDMEICRECKGEGGWPVCPECGVLSDE